MAECSFNQNMQIPDINPQLFSQILVEEYFSRYINLKVPEWINSLDEESILTRDPNELVQDFISQNVPQIPKCGDAYALGEPQTILTERDRAGVHEYDHNSLKFVYVIPFVGDSVVFVLRPTDLIPFPGHS
jgi:hypothetical protein